MSFYAHRAAVGDKFGGTIYWSMQQLLVLVRDPTIIRKVSLKYVTNRSFIAGNIQHGFSLTNVNEGTCHGRSHVCKRFFQLLRRESGCRKGKQTYNTISIE